MKKDWQRYLGFRCTGCGNCCRGTVVMITDADIRRLADGTKRPIEEFARFVGEGDIEIDKRSPWWVKMESRRYILALRWENKQCVFLGDDNLCGAYEHRPIACREHPFNITHSESGALMHLSMSRIVPCPHEWDGDLKRRDLVTLSRWTARESESYTDRVRLWNRQHEGRRTKAGFLEYLGLT